MILLGILSDHRAAKSASPAMHNRVLEVCGLAGAYLPFEVAAGDVGPAVAGLKALGFAGANVTVPHKQAVMPFVDELTGEAEAIGAVNTIVNRNGRLTGDNTDARGFAAALSETGFQASGKHVLVIGAGGASRAVLHALAGLEPASLTVAARNRDSAAELAAPAGARPASLKEAAAADLGQQLIVNCTSVSGPDESAEMAAWAAGLRVKGLEMVCDINYGRSDNFWAGMAAARGADFSDGLAMLAHQARLSFAAWTGLEVKVAEFRAGLGVGR